jgi:hypothetical protein
MLPCFDEIIIQKNLPLCMNELPMAEGHECGAGVNSSCLLYCDVPEVCWQLTMNHQHVVYEYSIEWT